MKKKTKIIWIVLAVVIATASAAILCNRYQTALQDQTIRHLTTIAQQITPQIDRNQLSEADGETFLRATGCNFLVLCRLKNNNFMPIPGAAFPKSHSNYVPTVDDPAVHFSNSSSPRYTTNAIAAEHLLAISVPTKFKNLPAYAFIGTPAPNTHIIACLWIIAVLALPLILTIIIVVHCPTANYTPPPPPPRKTSRTEVTEKQIIQLGRLTALRQVTSGIIHEINQPLCVIKGYLGLLQMMGEQKTDNDDGVQKYLEICLHNIDRTGHILDHIRSFVRDYNEEAENVDVPKAIQNVLDFFGEQFSKRNIKLELKIPERTAPVKASPAMVEQMIVNLLSNARDSFQSAGNQEYAAGIKIVTVRLEELKGSLLFTVEDNGCGMDAEALKHCTDPFYTTTADNCGLGLSSVKILCAKFHGQLKINSIRGRGTSVSMSLPLENE